MHKRVSLLPVAFVVACRPEPRDPFATHLALPAEEPPLAQIGTTVAVGSTELLVADDGTIDAPLCGPIAVNGLDAAAICDLIATCSAKYVRQAAIEISLGGVAVACQAETSGGDLPPTSPALLELVAAAGDHDASVVDEAVEAALRHRELVVDHKPEHPDAVEARTRLQALVRLAVKSAPASGRDAAVLSESIAARLVAVDDALALSAVSRGPEHPEVRRIAARRALLVELIAAASAPATKATLVVELVELQAQLDQPPPVGPAIAKRREAAAEQLGTYEPTRSDCPALLAAFDRRTSAWRDRKGGDEVVDALLAARVELVARLRCGATPAPPP